MGGCWERKKVGLGAVVIKTATGEKQVSVGEVPPPLIAKWGQQVGDQLICQIELYALVVIRWMLTNRRSIWWVDN
jgi:hypothetical protein